MLPGSNRLRRGLRAVAAHLALLATFAAVGQPVVHAWAHEAEEEHHDEVRTGAEADHSHEEIHPLALHDDYVPVQRAGPDVSAPLPIPAFELTVDSSTSMRPIHSVPRAPSRAPPAQDRARAPPSA